MCPRYLDAGSGGDGQESYVFFVWFVFSDNGIENDFLRRWIRKIGRLQDSKTVENVAKLKKGRLTELENAIAARTDCRNRGGCRCGHVACGTRI